MKKIILYFILLIANQTLADDVFDILNSTNEEFNLSEPDSQINNSEEIVNNSELKINHQTTGLDQNNFNSVKINILDRILAKSTNMNIQIGTNIHFNDIEITPKLCFQNNIGNVKDSKALIEVKLLKDGHKERLFQGWIFSMKPSISVFENPFYNIALVECNNNFKVDTKN